MKIIARGIIALSIVAAIAICSINFYQSYLRANTYASLGIMDKLIISQTEPESYESLENSYNFISSLPIIGNRLTAVSIFT